MSKSLQKDYDCLRENNIQSLTRKIECQSSCKTNCVRLVIPKFLMRADNQLTSQQMLAIALYSASAEGGQWPMFQKSNLVIALLI